MSFLCSFTFLLIIMLLWFQSSGKKNGIYWYSIVYNFLANQLLHKVGLLDFLLRINFPLILQTTWLNLSVRFEKAETTEEKWNSVKNFVLDINTGHWKKNFFLVHFISVR